jgi:pimeloyl-ACP methyl ester carboxylesterase
VRFGPPLNDGPMSICQRQHYGGPVGFRMALAHPERVQALIVQDAVGVLSPNRRKLPDGIFGGLGLEPPKGL